MGRPHRRFGKEFEAEAVCLVETSGRTQKQVADDLGIGRSTLRNWLAKWREGSLEAPEPGRQEDLAAKLKRLRRENAVLRQEREILKRAATFFAKEGSRRGCASSMRREHLLDGEQADFGEKRCRAFIEWKTHRGVFEPDWCLIGKKSKEGGHGLATRVLSEPDRPVVLVTANDNIAVGAYRAIAELGLRVLSDIAVVSFNDISVAQFLNPPLSTVRLPSGEIGENAVALLLERIAGRDVPKRVVLGSGTIWRGSTRVPAADKVALKSAW